MADGHERHDLEAVVAFADSQVGPEERERIAARVASCSSCSELVRDMRALSLANRDLAMPARTREFRLTTADAARLLASGPEPASPPARLGGEMPTFPSPSPSPHDRHDPTLIAGHVDRTLTDGERVRVDAWLATCADCAELRADLASIAAAHRSMPTLPRPRDYRLTDRDVRRLRAARWRGLVSWLGSSRDAVSRPLAAGLTAIGLAGIMLTSGAWPLIGSQGGATQTIGSPATAGAGAGGVPEVDGDRVDDSNAFTGAGEVPPSAPGAGVPSGSTAPSRAPASVTAGPSASLTALGPEASALRPAGSPPVASGAASAAPSGAASEGGSVAPIGRVTASPSQRDASKALGSLDRAGSTTDASTLTLGMVLSLVALIVGLGLFVLRWSAGRARAS